MVHQTVWRTEKKGVWDMAKNSKSGKWLGTVYSCPTKYGVRTLDLSKLSAEAKKYVLGLGCAFILRQYSAEKPGQLYNGVIRTSKTGKSKSEKITDLAKGMPIAEKAALLVNGMTAAEKAVLLAMLGK